MSSIATPCRDDEPGGPYGGCECGSDEEVYVCADGRRVCQTCQEHPEWSGYGDEFAYEQWLRDRGLHVDGWMTGWEVPA